ITTFKIELTCSTYSQNIPPPEKNLHTPNMREKTDSGKTPLIVLILTQPETHKQMTEFSIKKTALQVEGSTS
ncbi:hypothetical protein, partial [Salmonella enterica]|uniref:hypothetical protein n=1 Tax=Salmonella enterica TaxID=28901 RepID=UPI001C0CE17E